MNKKIALYLRVSTDQQLDSISNQSFGLIRKAEFEQDQIVKEYKDEGISGTDIRKRKDLQELLYDAGINVDFFIPHNRLENGNFDIITSNTKVVFSNSTRDSLFDELWVKNTSRLFRRSIMSSQVLEIFRQRNIVIRFVEQGFSTDQISCDLLIKIFAILDEEESQTKSSRVRWGYEQSIKKNVLHNSRLFGFDYIKETNSLVPNQDSKTIQRIFDLYTEEKKGYLQIQKTLEKEGYLTYSKKSTWTKTTIHHILNNPKYSGLNYSEKRWESGVVFNKISPRMNKDIKLIKNENITPIISQEQYFKCQEILKNRQANFQNDSNYKGKTELVSLGFVIKCNNCGASYTSNWEYDKKTREKKYQFYNCSNKKKHRGLCNNPNIKKDFLDKYIDDLRKNFKNHLIEEINFEKHLYFLTLEEYILQLEERDVKKELDKIDNFIKEKMIDYSIYLKEKNTTEDSLRISLISDLIENLENELDSLKNKRIELLSFREKTLFIIEDCLKTIEFLDNYKLKDNYEIEDVASRLKMILINKDGTISHLKKWLLTEKDYLLKENFNRIFYQTNVDDLYEKCKKLGFDYKISTVDIDSLINYFESNGMDY